MCGEKGTGKCRQDNITYQIKCTHCGDIYIGESSRNAYTRGKEHLYQMEKKDKDSIMFRHYNHKHRDNEIPTYKMSVTGTYRSALDRQISEAVKINRAPRDIIINNKSEFKQNKMMRSELVFEWRKIERKIVRKSVRY